MSTKKRGLRRGHIGRVTDVRFAEVEFDAPVGTRMIIEIEGGLRLLVADDGAVELAAHMINSLAQLQKGGCK